MNIEKLKERIQPDEIQWRVQSVKNGKTTVVPYLNNRCVQQRFDEAFGPMRWQNHFEEWRGKGVKCSISVFDSELRNWVTKSDGADETNIESTKGGFSDSMKRCAVQWGLGRDLYDYPLIQIEGELKYIPQTVLLRLNKMVEQINEGGFDRSYVLIK